MATDVSLRIHVMIIRAGTMEHASVDMVQTTCVCVTESFTEPTVKISIFAD